MTMMRGAFAFDGETYEPEFDFDRLKGQLQRVFALMQDGKWRSLGHIAQATGGSEAAVSARLRDLRKDKFGGHEVERQRLDGGLYLYRLIVRVPEAEGAEE
jgi:biotin operon repressor